MTGISIETTLELWASSLRAVKARMAPLFTQERVAASAGLFLDGLFGDERRKTGWMRAEAAGDPGPWRQQAILGRGWWDADALRDIVREYALETLADQDAVLVLDETGFLKQGKASCGVARQYTGSAGKITNCQIGVFCAYVSCHGHAFIDRAYAALSIRRVRTDLINRATLPALLNALDRHVVALGGYMQDYEKNKNDFAAELAGCGANLTSIQQKITDTTKVNVYSLQWKIARYKGQFLFSRKGPQNSEQDARTIYNGLIAI